MTGDNVTLRPMNLDDFVQSVESDPAPPEELTDELRALWLAKNGHWDASHEIVQEIDTPVGSWIHALLHLIEGDIGNAGYWYRRAERPAKSREQIDEEWAVIAAELTGAQ